MSDLEKILIEAIIPHQSDPDLHIVTSQGDYPSRTYEQGNGTLEQTFRTIGQDILGRVISVDRRRVDLEVEGTSIVYQAKPVNHSLNPTSDYQWMKRP
jgi:hypothetical protein